MDDPKGSQAFVVIAMLCTWCLIQLPTVTLGTEQSGFNTPAVINSFSASGMYMCSLCATLTHYY